MIILFFHLSASAAVYLVCEEDNIVVRPEIYLVSYIVIVRLSLRSHVLLGFFQIEKGCFV